MRLWRNAEGTREGKYLVLRRSDGSVFPHPCMVLGAKDPAAPEAILAYASAVEGCGFAYVGQLGTNAFVIRRRDGTEPEWPGVVLHAADPAAPAALTAYADAAARIGMDAEYVADVRRMANEFRDYAAAATQYRRQFAEELTDAEKVTLGDLGLDSGATDEDMRAYARRAWEVATEFELFRMRHGAGDPDAPRHRRDDPATIELMRGGRGA